MPSTTDQQLPPTWRLSVAGLAAVGVSFGFARYGYGLFLPDIRSEFGLSVSAVGLIGSATYVGYLGALVLVGALATHLGPRALIVIGGMSAAVGAALVSMAPGIEILAAGLVLAGTSSGWIWAPFSDAVDRLVPAPARSRVLAVIPSGTAFGVVVTGPLALLTHGSAWRYAWLVFAAGALAATVYNIRILPGRARRGTREPKSRVGLRWFARPAAVPLYATALSYGVVGSVYWLLAVEAVSATGGMGRHTAPLFWTVIGAAGTLGVGTGVVFARLGLRTSHVLLFGSLALALALLGVAPGALPAVLTSALLYGPAFMAGSALLAVWSYDVFPDRPTTGFSATVLFLGLGTIVAPASVGALADRHGLDAAFLVTAAVATATMLIAPHGRVAAGRWGRPDGANSATPRRLARPTSPF